MTDQNETAQPHLSRFAENCRLRKGDAREWVIIHSHRIDEFGANSAISPPMLAMNWEMATVIFNSLLEASLENLCHERTDAWVACLEDKNEVLRLGLFDEMGEHVIPQQMFVLMDKRALTKELYGEMYGEKPVKDNNTYVRDFPLKEAPAKVLH